MASRSFSGGRGLGGAGLGVPREIRKRAERSARLLPKRDAFDGNDFSSRRKDYPTRGTWRPGRLGRDRRLVRPHIAGLFKRVVATRSQAAGGRPDSIGPA